MTRVDQTADNTHIIKELRSRTSPFTIASRMVHWGLIYPLATVTATAAIIGGLLYNEDTREDTAEFLYKNGGRTLMMQAPQTATYVPILDEAMGLNTQPNIPLATLPKPVADDFQQRSHPPADAVTPNQGTDLEVAKKVIKGDRAYTQRENPPADSANPNPNVDLKVDDNTNTTTVTRQAAPTEVKTTPVNPKPAQQTQDQAIQDFIAGLAPNLASFFTDQKQREGFIKSCLADAPASTKSRLTRHINGGEWAYPVQLAWQCTTIAVAIAQNNGDALGDNYILDGQVGNGSVKAIQKLGMADFTGAPAQRSAMSAAFMEAWNAPATQNIGQIMVYQQQKDTPKPNGPGQ